jgi:hypothetical protein
VIEGNEDPLQGKEEQYIPPQQIVSTKIKNVYSWYLGVVAVTNTTTKDCYKEVKYGKY